MAKTDYSKCNVITRVRRTLLNYSIEIERVEKEIELRKETMDLYSFSNKLADKRKFIEAKVEKENYEVFLNRLKNQKKGLLEKVDLVACKYGNSYSNIFTQRFFENKTIEEIAETHNMSYEAVFELVKKMRNDIYGFFPKKNKEQ